MRRRKKDREEKIDVRGIIAILFVILLTINNDLLSNNNKKHDLLNLIIDFITYRRRYIRFAWIDV